MHRTRRAARDVANNDPKNPFARTWIKKKAGPIESSSDIENGDSALFRRVATDDPTSSRPRVDTIDDTILEHNTKEADSGPLRRIESAPIVTAIAEHESKVSDPATEVEEIIGVVKSSHGRKGWFRRTTTNATNDSNDKHEEAKKKSTLTVAGQVRVLLLNSWIKIVLLPLVPVGFAINYTHQNPVTIFAINFVAIIPLTMILGEAADDLILRVGDSLAALINLSFCNAVQFIISILLLRDNQIAILQTSLIGAVLSSMHLMLGLSFLVGGINRVEQAYNTTVAKISANLLLLAMVALILPTMADRMGSITKEHITKVSRGIAVILILVYLVYLFFQLRSHAVIYRSPSEKNPKRDFTKQKIKVRNMIPSDLRRLETRANSDLDQDADDSEDDEEQDKPQLSLFTVAVVFIVCTTLLGFTVAFATGNLDGLMAHTNISETFIGIVLLPLLSNDFTIMSAAIKDKMDICVSLTIGKCLQTILLVVPFTVLLGWIMHRDMTLDFDAFEATALFASVLYISSMIQGGRSNYLDGVLLLSVFLIICLTSYWV